MSRRSFRLAVSAGAALLLAGVIVVTEAGPAAAADITTACTGTLAGSTFTLTADCATTEPLTVPDGVTVDGQGQFTISASDPAGAQWSGGILTSAGASMNVRNVTITGPPGGFQLPTNCPQGGPPQVFTIYGIYFFNASGTVDNVTIDHLYQMQGNFGSCQTGRAIRVESTTSTPQTVDITNTTATDYQKTAFEARGAAVTMNISGSTAGPPHDLRGLMAQNGITYVGAAGTVANNVIWGSGDQQDGFGGNADGTAVLLFGAHGVTVDHNTLQGPGTDIGVGVMAESTDITISFNTVGRDSADDPDPTGFGIFVEGPGPLVAHVGEGTRQTADGSSEATLICNTFSGWNHNIVGALQVDCTPLPSGAECVTYSANAPNIEGGTIDAEGAFVPPVEPITWEVATGSPPPGVTMAPDGTFTGTPTQQGSFAFTLHVTDSSAPPLTATSDQTVEVVPGCETTTTTTIAPTTTTDGSGVGAAEVAQTTAVTQSEPLARTGGPWTQLVGVGLVVLASGLALLLAAAWRRSRLRAGPTNPA